MRGINVNEGTRKLKFMKNKSKNRNMKKCSLKNKTPRGHEKKIKKEKKDWDKNVDFVA